jgi:hypothetical protein
MSYTDAEEIDRMNERVYTEEGGSALVQDRDSYDLIYNDILGVDEKGLTEGQRKFRETTFKAYVQEHPEVSKKRLFSKAGGKDLEKDRMRTSQEVVTTEKSYIEKGAKRTDLVGYDTKTQEFSKTLAKFRRRQEIRKVFTKSGIIKGKVVKVRDTVVKLPAKRQKKTIILTRARDKLGRFASVK